MPEAELLQAPSLIRHPPQEAALAELNHRVANNLQIIGALLLRAMRIEPASMPEQVAEAAKRLAIMSGLHRRLCSPLTPLSTVEDHLLALCEDLVALHGRSDVTLAVLADDLDLSPACENAISLITAELVANALRHAFQSGPGRIEVSLIANSGEAKLRVSDDGCGMMEISMLDQGKRNGLRIVRGLASGIGGVVSAHSEPGRGLEIIVTFLVQAGVTRGPDRHWRTPGLIK